LKQRDAAEFEKGPRNAGFAGPGSFGAHSLAVGKLPRIKVVELRSILPHEESDPERLETVTERIRAEGLLRHPPIAARDHGAASHILLDGVNRFEALRRLGARFVVIQEVELDDPELKCSTWHHEIEGLDVEQALTELSSPTKLVRLEGEFTDSGDFLPRFDQDVACCIVLPNGDCYAASAGNSTSSKLEVIREVAGNFCAPGKRDRVSYTNLHDLQEHYPGFSALICYRPFTKTEILKACVEGLKFPSGVTRFSVPKRALSLGIPLSALRKDGNLEEKEAMLEQLVTEKIRSRKIRLYEEPTFHFDD